MNTLSKPISALCAFGILMFYLIVPTFFLWVITIAKRTDELSSVLSDLFSVAGYIMALVIIAGRFRKRGVDFSLATGFDPRNMDGKNAFLIAVSGISAGLTVSALLNLIPFPSEWMEAYDGASLAQFRGDGLIVAVLIAMVFLPLSEEFIFRGFLLKTLLRGFSPKVSVIAVSAVFAVLHVHPLWIVYAFLLGMLLGWLALEFKNLTASVMFHLGFNISSLPLIFTQEKGSYAVVLSNPFFLSAIVAVCGALSFYLLFKLKRKEA